MAGNIIWLIILATAYTFAETVMHHPLITKRNNFTRNSITRGDFKCSPWKAKLPDSGYSCNYSISDTSQNALVKGVSAKYQFIHLRLKFEGNVNSTQCVLEPTHWYWTAAGGRGRYLELPVFFDIWSLGILNNSVLGPIDIDIKSHGQCQLIVGEQASTTQLATSFAQLGHAISMLNETRLQKSFFCYMESGFIYSHVLYMFCLHFICPLELIGYRCCDYEDDIVTCETKPYSYSFWCGQFPYVVGMILSIFSPLILMSFARAVYDEIRKRKPTLTRGLKICQKEIFNDIKKSYGTSDATDKSQYNMSDSNFILETETKPVTCVSLIFLFIMRCFSYRVTVVSRLLRALFPVGSMALVALKTLLFYKYHGALIVDAVEKGVPMGFTSMAAGIYDSDKIFLCYLGGPYVACVAYVVIGAILISLPKDFSKTLEKALYDNKDIATSPLTLDQASIQKYGLVRVIGRGGYRKVQSQMRGQFYMLLNPAFWKHVVKIQFHRWMNLVVYRHTANKLAVGVFICLTLIPYVVICVCENVMAILYYGLPIVNFTYTIIRAQFQNTAGCRYSSLVRTALSVSVSFLALYVMYIFILVFLDSSLFLTRIAMYVYMGIFCRPEECYSYVVFGIWVLYYLRDSVDNIAKVYRSLLKTTIAASQELQRENKNRPRTFIFYINNIPGIPEDLFEYIIDRHKPRTKEVFLSVVRVVFIILLILFSLRIITAFGTSTIYLMVNVFQVVFICLVPKLVTSMCTHADRGVEEKYYKENLKETVLNFWQTVKMVQPMQNLNKLHNSVSEGISETETTSVDMEKESETETETETEELLHALNRVYHASPS